MRDAEAKSVHNIAAKVVSVRDYVRVLEDFSVGSLSYGGFGFIDDLNQSRYTASVKYGNQDGQTFEKNIGYLRITKVPY